MSTKRDDTKIVDWVIYKITSPTGRVYIGKTCNFSGRINNYRNHNNHKQKLLHSSFNKYDFSNHKIEIIDKFSSDDGYANGKEMFWIKSHMSNKAKYPEQNGLNLTDGGEGVRGRRFFKVKRGPMSEQQKQKQREFFKGKKYRLGIKHTPESKEKISLSKSKKYGKPIIQYDLNGGFIKEYPALRIAAKETGMDRRCIKEIAIGVIKTPKQYIFKFK